MQIIGHRGACGLASENTLPAITAGLEAGVDAIEVDLRLSLDGRIVIHHNPDFVTKDGVRLTIRQLPYKQLRQLLPEMPTLKDVAKRVLKNTKNVELILHCKDRLMAKKLSLKFEKLKTKGYEMKRIIVISLYAGDLAAFHRLQPQSRTYYLFRYTLFFHLLVCKLIRAEGAGYNWRYTLPPLPWLCHRHHLKVYYYTVNNPRLAKIFKRRGLDYLATDRPDLIRGVLDT